MWPQPPSALTVLPSPHTAGRCFLRPSPRGCMPWASSCSPSDCSLAVPAALATSSCQTAACRAASSPGPERPPSQLRDAHAGTGSRQTLWGQEESELWLPLPARAPFPVPFRMGLGGGGEGSTLSALRNVLWENAEAIIPSYFPWLTPRYSAGPLHSQAPALLLDRGRPEK